jgi:cystathionine beta-lyase
VPWLSVSPHGIVVTSASKAYNMAAIKAAIVVAGDASREVLERTPEIMRWGASNIGIVAHRAAWDGGDAWIDAVNANITAISELLAEHLRRDLPRAGPLPRVARLPRARLGDDPAEASASAGAWRSTPARSSVPAASFVRLNLACSRATLADAVARMATTTPNHPPTFPVRQWPDVR